MLVEKRTLTFALLAVLTLALITTSATLYYYLLQTRYQQQLREKQNLLNMIIEGYEEYTSKRNLLSSEYGELQGMFQFFVSKNWFNEENRSLCLNQFKFLLLSLGSNYTLFLQRFPEINATYTNLLNDTQTLVEKQVTPEKFEDLLADFYKLLNILAAKELENAIGETSQIHVNVCINYTKIIGQLTIEWYNVSVPVGTTLFDLTRRIANVTYDYYAAMEPGHIIITSINDYQAWWIWYYWDYDVKDWSWGPVGCDAWGLKNNETYKWDIFP